MNDRRPPRTPHPARDGKGRRRAEIRAGRRAAAPDSARREARAPVAPTRDPAAIRLSVRSEVGRLRKVMLHRPGREMDRMLPSHMDELLFDDILYGEAARVEHDAFRRVLEQVADEVLEIQDVLAEALQDAVGRERFVTSLAHLEKLSASTEEYLSSLSPEELAQVAIGGLEFGPAEVAAHTRPWSPFLVSPVPNLLFVRDPLVVVNDGALVCSMARRARRREPMIMRFAYAQHPRLQLEAQGRFFFDDLGLESLRRRIHIPGLEGGDVLVMGDRILVVGGSERTNEVAVDLLTEALVTRTSIDVVLLVLMPKHRSTMHLDTVFTQISAHECLVYPPMFMPDALDLLPVIKKDLRGRFVRSEFKPSLLEALREEGHELEPICCGGRGDLISQQREQWTDGANAFALAPGVITLYERNVRTAEELSRAGYAIVETDELLNGKKSLVLDGKHRYCVMIHGPELSRARGGPRCMTMPLVRDPV